MHVSHRARRTLLSVGTAFVVAYVRRGLEVDWASWDSWTQALSYWVIHWIGLALFSVIAALVIERGRRLFLEGKPDLIAIDDLQVQIFLTVLVASVVIFLLAHLPPGLGNQELGL